MAALLSQVKFTSQEPILIYSRPIPGPIYNDTVTISNGITISQQYIGVASNSSGISPLDGILG